MNLDLLLEAERRGILPPDKAELLAEARRRGLVGGESTKAPTEPNTNPGVQADAPPEMFFNPQTGQYTSRELLKNHMIQNETAPTTAAGATIMGAGRGATFGGIDELSGYLNAAIPGQGTMAERNTFGREMARAAEEVGAETNPDDMLTSEIAGAISLPITAPLQGAKLLPRIAGSIATGGSLGAIYGALTGEGKDERVDQAQSGGTLGAIVGALTPLVGAGVQKVRQGAATRRAVNEFVEAAPGTEGLVRQASDKFDDAARSGITAQPNQTLAVLQDAVSELQSEGLLSPSGKIPAGYAKVSTAVDMLADFGDEAMTPKQMQEVRKILMEAARQPGAEGRIGAKLVEKFDGVMEPLAPQIKQGNEIYTRAMKSKLFEEIDQLAKNDAGANYTAAGYEHALRRRFKSLLDKIVKGKETRFTEAEVEAIRRVANGGTVENVAREIGKYAPKGPMAAMLSAGGPTVIGSALGLPSGVAGALGLGAWGAGTAGRMAATNMQTRNAAIARALAATGAVPNVPVVSDASRRVIEALTQRAGATVPQ